MQVVLVMFRDEGKRRSFSITRDVTVVGRREDCDFRIPLGEISRKHCRLIKDGGALKVEDLGSSNGTYHNGERVQSCELSPGDTLQIGSVAFVVQIDGAPLDDELQPQRATDAKATMPSADDSDRATTLTDEPAVAHHDSNGNGNGEFDPMSVLDSEEESEEGSAAMPAIEDSNAGSDVIPDLASQSHISEEQD